MNEPSVMLQTIAGLDVGTCVIGEGLPVVALHGWGGSIRSFWPVAERLSPNGYQVHLLDLPGFGQSTPPPETWGVAEYAHLVKDYLDAAGLKQAAILGHSFGGRIALVLAATYPERVRKMILADSAGLRTPPTLKQHLRNFAARTVRNVLDLAHLDGVRKRLQDRYNKRYASADFLAAGALRETFVRVIEEDLTTYAQRVKVPTVLIWGDRDTDTPLWQGRKLEQLIPDAGLIVFQGAGHFAYLDRLTDFVRIADHFLNDGS